MTNLSSKLSRAICAYLVSAGIDQKQVYPHFTAKERTLENGPIVTPLIYPGQPEPVLVGDKRFKIGVQVKGGESNDGSAGADEAKRVEFDAFVGEVNEALMQTDEAAGQTLKATIAAINAEGRALAVVEAPEIEAGKEAWCKAANNADMADFTLTQWIDSTVGGGEAKDCTWEIVIMFAGSACESNVD